MRFDNVKFLGTDNLTAVHVKTLYRICKALNLNPGNVNAFLKYGDVSKAGLNTARKN